MIFEKLAALLSEQFGVDVDSITMDTSFEDLGADSLDIVEIPTNKPVQRVDHPDVVYKTEAGKFRAIVNQIEECHKKGQPVLVGTISIEKSEELSAMLKKRGIRHNVLNAKFHEKEAEIVAQAGKLGAVTVATNMAGRGTDIMLGGNAEYLAKAELRKAGLSDELIAESTGYADTDNEEILNARKMFAEAEAKYKDEIKAEADQVRAAGGLFILGTERHESRRIDNQLRGRAGRQGDPGESRFYLSLEDDIMRLFGSERVMGMMEKLGVDEDTPIDAKILSNAIENAQKQVESRNFQTRKTVLEYDDVMNLQRVAIYSERNAILDGKDMDERIPEIIGDAVEAVVAENCPAKVPSDDWDAKAVELWAANMTGRDDFSVAEVDHDDDPAVLSEALEAYLEDVFASKSEQLGEPVMKMLEGQVMLRMIDTRWMAHLQEMDYLKAGIGLRAFGQRDPLVEYKNEAYNAFQNLTAGMYEDYLRTLLRLQVAVKQEQPALAEDKSPLDGKVSYSSPEQALEQTGVGAARKQAAAAPPKSAAAKPQTYTKDKDDPFANVGRNEPCPCGSGLKYKKCHGRDQ